MESRTDRTSSHYATTTQLDFVLFEPFVPNPVWHGDSPKLESARRDFVRPF